MDNIIIDGMRKEGKPARIIMIIGYVLMVLVPFVLKLTKGESFSNRDLVIISKYCFIVGSIGLYGFIYSIKYHLEITSEKLILKTLFKKIEINIKDIMTVTCKRYRSNAFYQFNLSLKDKKVIVYTRYKDEFIKILEENNIEQISK